jgi:hypothetical protein
MLAAIVIVLSLLAGAVRAGEADVVDVRFSETSNGVYRFDVTVRHADTGWDHYADAFEVLAPDGEVLGTRTLLHPHENEQPFTRSLTGVAIPAGIEAVTVRAHDSIDGYGGAELTVTLSE